MNPRRIAQVTALLESFIEESAAIAIAIKAAQPEFVCWTLWIFNNYDAQPRQEHLPPIYLCLVSTEGGEPEVFRELQFRFLPDRVVTMAKAITPRISLIDYELPKGFESARHDPFKKMPIGTGTSPAKR